MNIDCQWIEKNMEALLGEGLGVEHSGLASRHIESCAQCRQKLDELSSIDPLIQRFFRHEMAVARAPQRPRWSILAGVPAATAAAGLVVVVVLRTFQAVAPPPVLIQANPPAAVAATPVQAPPVPKTSNTAPEDRSKPEPAAPNNMIAPSTRSTAPSKEGKNAKADFVVTDPAGYSRTLRDYSGHILILGVWSGKQPQTVATLERVYQTFGPDTKLRILGVANERQRKPLTATFPIVYNQGSALLGANESEFLIVDDKGEVRARGSLLQDTNAVIASIRSALAKIKS